MLRGATCEKEINTWRTKLLFRTQVETIPSEYFSDRIATALQYRIILSAFLRVFTNKVFVS
jgi:hypothetical protein